MTSQDSRPRVVITDRRFSDPDRIASDRYSHPDPYSEAIEAAGGEVVYGDFETVDEVVEGCRDADIVVTFKAPITRRVFENMGDVRLVFRNGAGYDNVDIKAANEHGVPVSVIQGYVNDELAEHAIALALAAARDVTVSDRRMREANGWGSRTPIQPMSGKTFGVVGLGEIGRTVVPKARGIGMDVIGTDPYQPQFTFDALDVERVEFDELLERADAISVHCQLTAETHHLFSTAEFEAMRDNAVLVNTARGPIIDEAALVDAIEAGELWGAGLDVFETEPPVGSPALSCDRIVCSPHHGGNCTETQERAIRIATDEIVRAVEGRKPRNVVNPEALKYDSDLMNPELGSWE